jgi:predicted PurR-regulated permease PerM
MDNAITLLLLALLIILTVIGFEIMKQLKNIAQSLEKSNNSESKQK